MGETVWYFEWVIGMYVGESVCLFDLIYITLCADSRGIEYDSLEQ